MIMAKNIQFELKKKTHLLLYNMTNQDPVMHI